MKTIWQRIEDARARWDVLQHPFYLRWSAGELSREELAGYAGQYRHATEAIARLSAQAAEAAPEPERAELLRHAGEEADHVALWDGFVDSVGGQIGAEPTPETRSCVADWTPRMASFPRWFASTRSRAASRRSRGPSVRGSPSTTASATAMATRTSASTSVSTSSTPRPGGS